MTDVNVSAVERHAPDVSGAQGSGTDGTGAVVSDTAVSDAAVSDAAVSDAAGTQPPAAGPALSGLRSTLPTWSLLALGVALAFASINPAHLLSRGPAGWLLAVAAVAMAVWAAPAVAERPASEAVQWFSRLIRHRNTAFAVACTVLAAFSDPAFWMAVVDTALLLAYLLAVDAFAAGPIGAEQLRGGLRPLAAAAASAVALLGAQAPVAPGTVWGRIVAALAVAAAAAAAGAALWLRISSTPISERDGLVGLVRRRRRDRPRHLL